MFGIKIEQGGVDCVEILLIVPACQNVYILFEIVADQEEGHLSYFTAWLVVKTALCEDLLDELCLEKTIVDLPRS